MIRKTITPPGGGRPARPVRVRLFQTYALLFSIVILAVMVLLGVQIRIKNQTEAITAVQEELRGDVRVITAMFESMENLSRQVNASGAFLNFFEAADADGDGDNWFDAHPGEAAEAGEILETFNSIDHKALRISAYNLKGDFISRGALACDSAVVRDKYENLPDVMEGQYAIIERNGGAFAVSGPHPDFWQENDKQEMNIVSFLTYLRRPYRDKIYGVLDIQYDIGDFTRLPFFATDGDSRTLLFDDWGRSGFVESGNYKETEAFYARLQAIWNETGDYVYHYKEDGREWIAIGEKEYKSNWMLVRVVSQKLLDGRYASVYVAFIAGTLVLLGVLLYTIWAISRMLAKPMGQLADSIEQVGIKHMEPLPDFPSRYRSHETECIRDAFNQMLARLNSSIDFEMKAYLKALQSQMDPHFLYNCLNIIADAAEEEGSTRVVRMCERLALLLRCRANYVNDFVPLSEEIEDIQNYMEMMKARYEDQFSYIIDIPEAMNVLTVPHVILQPLVENCFKHGFMCTDPPWEITVRGRIEDGFWRICIRDNGSGMTPEELAALRRKLDECRENVANHYSRLKIGGMGLVNTYMRLAMLSRGDIRMAVESPQSGGTEVMIGGAL